MNKLCIASTSLVDSPPLEFVDAAARGGFQAMGLRVFRSPGVTLYPFHPIVHDEQLMRDTKKAVQDAGIEVLEVQSFYIQPEMDWERFKKPLEFGAELGARYTLVIGDDTEDWSRQVDNFAKLCELAGSFGIKACLEAPVSNRALPTMELNHKLIKDSGTSNGFMCIDPFQFMRAGQTMDMVKDIDTALFPYTQVTDGKLGVPGRLAPGEGDAPIKELLDWLPEGIEISLEWSQPEGSSYTAAEWAKIAYEGTQKFLQDYYAAKTK